MEENKPKTLEQIKLLVIKNIKYIFDPEIPVNIYDFGLIYDIKLEIKDNYTYCSIDLTFTSPACPVADTIYSEIFYYTKSIPEIDEVTINIVFDPPWNFTKISKEGLAILELEGTIIPQY